MTVRRVLVVSAAAVVAGAAAILALDAAARAWGNPAASVLVALAAVFITQALLVAYLLTRRTR